MQEICLKIVFDSPEFNRSIIFSMYLSSMTKKMNQFLRHFRMNISLAQHWSPPTSSVGLAATAEVSNAWPSPHHSQLTLPEYLAKPPRLQIEMLHANTQDGLHQPGFVNLPVALLPGANNSAPSKAHLAGDNSSTCTMPLPFEVIANFAGGLRRDTAALSSQSSLARINWESRRSNITKNFKPGTQRWSPTNCGGEVAVLGTRLLSGSAHGCCLHNLKEGEEQKEALEAKDDEEKESEVDGQVEERERVNQRVHET